MRRCVLKGCLGSPMKGMGSGASSVLRYGWGGWGRDLKENAWVRSHISFRHVVIGFLLLWYLIRPSKFPVADNGDSWAEKWRQVVEVTGRLTKYSTFGKRGALPVKTDIV